MIKKLRELVNNSTWDADAIAEVRQALPKLLHAVDAAKAHMDGMERMLAERRAAMDVLIAQATTSSEISVLENAKRESETVRLLRAALKELGE